MIEGIKPIYKRELRAYLYASSTWIALGLFFLVTGAIYHDLLVIFSDQCAQSGKNFETPPNITVAVVGDAFNMMNGMLLFAMPILTMRLLAAERAAGTFEVLATCPVTDWAILLGKYLALLTLGAGIVLASAIYPVATWWLGRSAGAVPELSVSLACQFGLFLLFAAYGAFGLMASALTRSQITASVITLIGLLLWNMLGEFPVQNDFLRQLVGELSAGQHVKEFTSGLFTLRDLVFYAGSSFIFLFVAARALEARQWRG